MAKYVLFSFIVLAVIGGAVGVYHLYRVSDRNKKEMSEYSGDNVVVNKSFGKVLVVYFSLGGHNNSGKQCRHIS